VKPSEVGRLARTVRHLSPTQLGHRVRLRAQKQVYQAAPSLTARLFDASTSRAAAWPHSFRPVDASNEAVGRPSLEDNVRGRFDLLDVVRDLGHPIDWQPANASQLWRYHLHYFDWAWVLLQDGSPPATGAFAELYRSWRDANPVGCWDAWSPYVVALRAWTLCSIAGSLRSDAELSAELRADLVVHARYLRANVEFDVGGNHLLKNLKGLIGLAVFLGDAHLLRFSSRHLARQVDLQVLADGGHFERSPGYHAQVLGDLIDVHGLLVAAEALPGLTVTLAHAIERMQRWLAVVVQPDGSVPLLNDSVPVGPRRLRDLGVTGAPLERLTVLEPSGYAVLRPRKGVSLVFDVGPPCPNELPAHAQADALSLLLQVCGVDVLTDTGTSTYVAGERRQYERSTRAHNALEVDGQDQTEVYGAFRAGRRHRVTIHRVDEQPGRLVVEASHDGYRHLRGRPVHRRSVTVTEDGVEILDRVIGRGTHEVVVYWHLGRQAVCDDESPTVDVVGTRLTMGLPQDASWEYVRGGTAPLGIAAQAHNVLYDAPCLIVRLPAAELPVELRTRIAW
jgi:uncharacterized heparinase superfamily protein